MNSNFMENLYLFFFYLTACILCISIAIIVSIGTAYLFIFLWNKTLDHFIDFLIVWKNRKGLTELPKPPREDY